jgi:uncharacterized protein (TIGR03435 family)
MLLTILLAATVLLQSPSFQAATIKPSNDAVGHSDLHIRTSRIAATGETLKDLVAIAYQMKDTQVTAGPAWADVERYDINAESNGAEQPQLLLMLQTLLADRFQLVIHHEERILPVYAMTVVNSGLKIKPAESQDGDSHSEGSNGSLTAEGVSMPKLADLLSRDLKLPVKDLTGVNGRYTFKIEWSTQGDTVDSQDAMFNALEQQLGVKLELRKVPIDTIVIDRAEKPGEN